MKKSSLPTTALAAIVIGFAVPALSVALAVTSSTEPAATEGSSSSVNMRFAPRSTNFHLFNPLQYIQMRHDRRVEREGLAPVSRSLESSVPASDDVPPCPPVAAEPSAHNAPSTASQPTLIELFNRLPSTQRDTMTKQLRSGACPQPQKDSSEEALNYISICERFMREQQRNAVRPASPMGTRHPYQER